MTQRPNSEVQVLVSEFWLSYFLIVWLLASHLTLPTPIYFLWREILLGSADVRWVITCELFGDVPSMEWILMHKDFFFFFAVIIIIKTFLSSLAFPPFLFLPLSISIILFLLSGSNGFQRYCQLLTRLPLAFSILPAELREKIEIQEFCLLRFPAA